jgi:hypothetical protein
MITTTLVANGATVYIIGPKQADLDRIAKIYNDASEKVGRGMIYGVEGDVRHKVCMLLIASLGIYLCFLSSC